jgi:hypothetical protein
MSDEQWIVKVQMIDDLRQFNVQTNKLHWGQGEGRRPDQCLVSPGQAYRNCLSRGD